MKNLLDKIKSTGRKSLICASLVSLPYLFSGCSKDEFEDVKKDNLENLNQNQTEDSGRTYVLNKEELNEMDSISSNGTIYFDSQQPELKRGDIIVSGIDKKTPNGMIRKIKNISPSFTKIETEQSNLEEAVNNDFLEKHISFSQEDIETTDMNRTIKNTGRKFSLGYEKIIYDADGNLNTKNDQVLLKGKIGFDLNTYLKMNFSKHKLDEAHIRGEVEGNIEIDLISESDNIILSKEKNLGHLQLNPFAIPLGVVPVVIKPEIDLIAKFDGKINSRTKSKIRDSFSLNCSLSYEGEKWVSEKQLSNSLGFELDAEGEANFKASVGPRLSLKFYGIAGPSIMPNTYLEFDADTEANPWWELHGGLETILGIDAEVIGKSVIDYEKIFPGKRIKLSEAEGSFGGNSENEFPTAYFEILPSIGTIETEFTFDASKSVDLSNAKVALNYRWDWDSDGIYDTDYSLNPLKKHFFNSSGNHQVTLEVLNQFSKKDTSSKTIEVSGEGSGNLDSLVIQPGPEGKDAYVTRNDLQDGTTHYLGSGDETFLEVGKSYPSYYGLTEEAFLQFPLKGVPSSKFHSAKLKLFGHGAVYGEEARVDASKVLGPWNEQEIKWDNKPSKNYIGFSNLESSKKWHEWDVTSTVDSWLKGEPNYGICLSSEDHRPFSDLGFKSGDYEEADKRPKLVVYYKK